MPIRLAISGADRRTLDRVKRICSRERDVAVVALYTTSKQTPHKLAQKRPDILVLDMRIRNADAFNVLRYSADTRLPTRCVILTGSKDDLALEALRLGVYGVVPVHMASGLLVRCIRGVHAGSKWLEPQLAIRVLQKLLGTAPSKHGHRTRRVARSLVRYRSWTAGQRRRSADSIQDPSSLARIESRRQSE